MDLSEIWLAYCADRLGPAIEDAEAIAIAPWRGVELLFRWHPLFVDKTDAIAAVPYAQSFDDEADFALVMLARDDAFDAFQTRSAGAWRVLYERLVFAETVLLVNEVRLNAVIGRLPVGLAEEQQSRALGLMFLLGGARTIDRRLLPRSKPGTLPSFPASTSLRLQ